MTRRRNGCNHPTPLNTLTLSEASMSLKDYPSIDYVRQCFREEDGRLFWLERPSHHFSTAGPWKTWNARFAGKEAGCLWKGSSRWQVTLNNRRLHRYHVVWALHHGEWASQIDHRDRNPHNDRIDNLRIATQSQNIFNRPADVRNKSGYRGVTWDAARGKWYACIQVHGRSKGLGRYDDPSDAHAAYLAAAREIFGEFLGG